MHINEPENSEPKTEFKAEFENFAALCKTVQHNCNIADARYAANYTMCVYLMKMREYFRWEKHYQFSDKLPSEAVGNWLSERERLWASIEQQPYQPLSINARFFDPFDADSINAQLLPKGYVYSSGIGAKSVPHFFIGRLLERKTLGDYQILISGSEGARDLTAPPAMRIGKTIFIRRESLKRTLWEKHSEWSWTKSKGIMQKALSFYDFSNHTEQALEQMCDAQIRTLILHELGEVKAGEQLGSNWLKMLLGLSPSRAELVARAVKDIIADLLSTLPDLLRRRHIPSIYFYIASQTPLQKQLFPSLSKTTADDDDAMLIDSIRQLIKPATKHWLGIATAILDLFEQNGTAAAADIAKLAESNAL